MYVVYKKINIYVLTFEFNNLDQIKKYLLKKNNLKFVYPMNEL